MLEVETLRPVPVRRVWANEASGFTPWLLANAKLLGDALGTELFPLEREASVGRYSADLLFSDSSDRLVVVENMFGTSDHDHLGKLITYAAGLEADVAVLIAESFRDEHRSSLDWLNRTRGTDFEFFGVLLEAWQIGDSAPAVHLRVDTKPDDWSRGRVATGDTPTQQAYRRFWSEFLPRLHETQPGWSGVSTPSKDNWMSFGSSRSELVKYNPSFCAQPRRGCRVEAYIDSTTVTPSGVFDWLSERREEIDTAIGESMEWDRIDGKRACRISAYFPDEVRVGDEDRWPELVEWMVATLGRVKSAFDPVIAAHP